MDASRRAKRRDLMLDDAVLDFRALHPRRFVPWRRAVYWVLCLLTAGTTWVIAQWSFMKRRVAQWLSQPCRQADADFFIFDSADGSCEVCEVEAQAEQALELLSGAEHAAARRPVHQVEKSRRMVVYRHTRFLWDDDAQGYRQLDCEAYTQPSAEGGLAAADAIARLRQVGSNVIDIPIPPWYVLLMRECISPYSIFQVWAVIVWLSEAYWSFSAFILLSALATAALNFWEVRKNLLEIRRLSRYTTRVRVQRDGGRVVEVDSSALVPGDVLLVEADMKLPCDCVLLRGQVTVNEAMLTGESTVVIKQPVPDARRVNEDADARNTLFGGSLVAQLRVPPGATVTAMVVRTGFESVKGRLVLAILYPRAPSFKFMEQSLMFIGLLFVLALGGFAANAKALADLDTPWPKIVQRGCDMVTIVVPPALPLALTVGIAYALVALRKDKVTCISPPRVNLAGKVNCFCFDKTGTLTTEGLELHCMRPVVRPSSGESSGVTFSDGEATAPAHLPDARFNMLLAACHSLTYVKGHLSGDPLELETFGFTGARIEEPHTMAAAAGGGSSAVDYCCIVHLRATGDGGSGAGAGPTAGAGAVAASPAAPGVLNVLRQFEFVPALQRMSVLAELASEASAAAATPAHPPRRVMAFVKGSPEMIHSLCRPESLPGDYFRVLKAYTSKGYRVLGAACKGYAPHLPVHPDPAAGISVDAIRAGVECDLTFLGFVVLENKLKPETTPTLQQLRDQAHIPLIMITGDNPISAVCVARDCTIVDTNIYRRVFLGDLHPTAAGAGYPQHTVTAALPSVASSSSSGHTPIASPQSATSASSLLHTSSGTSLLRGQQSPVADSLAFDGAPPIALATAATERQHSVVGFAADGGDEGGGTAYPAPAVSQGDHVVSIAMVEPLTPMVVPDRPGDDEGQSVALASAGPLAADTGRVDVGSLTGSAAPAAVTLRWVDVDDDGCELDPDSLALPAHARQPAVPYRLALTGRAYSYLLDAIKAGDRNTDYLQRVLANCVVYARMSPEQKASVVENLIAAGLYVGMTGDGQNDSLALRAAHVGISLSTVEASVSAPFTCSLPNIACVPRVLCEGRGALASSYSLFQFMALYSTIQFANALLIVFSGSFLSNNEYLYQDLFIVFILALTMGSTPSARRLTRKRPSANLLSPVNLTICAGFIACTFIMQVIVFERVRQQQWYGSEDYPTAMDPDEDEEGTNSKIPETSTVFLLAMLQYVAVATIFSLGYPWKRPTYSNYAFSGWLAVVTITSVLLFIFPSKSIYDWLSLVVMPQAWQLELLVWSILALLSYFAVYGCIMYWKRKGAFAAATRHCRCFRRQEKPHKRMRRHWEQLMGTRSR